MDFNEAKKIMGINKRFYDLLADDFARTRSDALEKFGSLGEYFKEGDSVLDLGCGNGRFYDLICQPDKQIKYFGVDNSSRLISLAKQKYPQGQFIVNDGLELPFSDNFFDKVLCLSVLHHLPGYDLRREFLRQTHRVLKKNGRLILAVSSRGRSWKLVLKYFWLKAMGRSKIDWGDFYEPWESGDNKARPLTSSSARHAYGEAMADGRSDGERGVRYFHNFSSREIRNSLEDSGFTIESISFLARKSGKKNIVAVAIK